MPLPKAISKSLMAEVRQKKDDQFNEGNFLGTILSQYYLPRSPGSLSILADMVSHSQIQEG